MMPLQEKWIIFDGDNTLWDVELLYNTARNDFCNWVASFGLSSIDVEIYQQEEDARLHQEFGYSIKRFPLSFENTLKHFLIDCTFEQVQYSRRIAESVFKSPAAPYPGVHSLLKELHEKFNLALLTCGDALVQRKRIDDFKSKSLLTKIYVVQEKSVATYAKIIEELNLDPSSSWMVGDSLKSDIIPANQLGVNTILIANKNWDRIEASNHNTPEQTRVCESINEVRDIVWRV